MGYPFLPKIILEILIEANIIYIVSMNQRSSRVSLDDPGNSDKTELISLFIKA